MTTKTNTNDRGATAGQLFTFDDVPLYARAYYLGRVGWVTAKGNNVTDASGRHLEITYREKYAGRKHSRIHEKLVNKGLRRQKKLWIDFDFKLDPQSIDQ